MDRPQAQNHFRPTVAGVDLTGKKQLRPLVKEWLARTQDYARGEASLHHLWTTIDGVDPEASMRHFPRKGGVSRNLGKHTFRMRGGDQVTQLMLHNRARTFPAPSPYCPLGCKDGQGRPWMDNWRHWYLCSRSGADGLNTGRHNATGRALLSGLTQGKMARFLTLTSFGRTDDDPEESTVPEWMLRGDRNGLADRPDLMIVKGWPRDRPPPRGPKDKPPEQYMQVQLILAELKYSDDMDMPAKHQVIRDKYAPLVRRLREAGWSVPHDTASIVIGHRSTALEVNKEAYGILGITGKRALQTLNNSLVDVSVKYTQKIVAATTRARNRHTRRVHNDVRERAGVARD
jgi:hypothetical protein